MAWSNWPTCAEGELARLLRRRSRRVIAVTILLCACERYGTVCAPTAARPCCSLTARWHSARRCIHTDFARDETRKQIFAACSPAHSTTLFSLARSLARSCSTSRAPACRRSLPSPLRELFSLPRSLCNVRRKAAKQFERRV